MVNNTPSVQSQPVPGEATSQTKPCPPDCDLPENSMENLDARLDHAIEETFPTSDPISVLVTKQAPAQEPEETTPAAFRSQSQEGQDQAGQDTAETLLDQVKEALQDVAQTTSGTVREAYREGQLYMRQAREHYPEAAHYYHDGRRAVRQRMGENPWPSLLVAGVVGYALAWMIHSKPFSRNRHVPDYARTRRGYASHRDDQHEV
jgi:ElaB/YqjD/DUF883 family membrane-anchored ribosome-binding protein